MKCTMMVWFGAVGLTCGLAVSLPVRQPPEPGLTGSRRSCWAGPSRDTISRRPGNFERGRLLAQANPAGDKAAGDKAVAETENAVDLVEWVMALPLTEVQRNSLKSVLSQLPNSTQDVLRGDVQRLLSTAVAQRPLLRGELLAHLQMDANLAGWITRTESQASRLIATQPELTYQVAEAFTEWVAFALEPSTFPQANPAVVEAIEDLLRQIAPQLKADQLAQLTRLPAEWAALRRSWPGMEPAQREALRARWKPILGQLIRQQDRLRVARVAISELKDSLLSGQSEAELAARISRLKQLSASLRLEKTAECTQVADQLDMLVFNLEQGKEQLETMDQLNQTFAQIAERSQLPGNDPQSLRPLFFYRGGIFIGGGEGLPLRF